MSTNRLDGKINRMRYGFKLGLGRGILERMIFSGEQDVRG
jgi:hypothetical protein